MLTSAANASTPSTMPTTGPVPRLGGVGAVDDSVGMASGAPTAAGVPAAPVCAAPTAVDVVPLAFAVPFPANAHWRSGVHV